MSRVLIPYGTTDGHTQEISRVFEEAVTLLGVSIALVGSLLGCNDPLAPFQPEITNVTNSFQFQATGVQNVTWSHDYAWQNTGTTANVDHSSAISAGTAMLIIRDAVGVQVYSSPLNPSGSVTTSAGVSGAWTIRVELVNLDGTLNFRVQKP